MPWVWWLAARDLSDPFLQFGVDLRSPARQPPPPRALRTLRPAAQGIRRRRTAAATQFPKMNSTSGHQLNRRWSFVRCFQPRSAA